MDHRIHPQLVAAANRATADALPRVRRLDPREVENMPRAQRDAIERGQALSMRGRHASMWNGGLTQQAGAEAYADPMAMVPPFMSEFQEGVAGSPGYGPSGWGWAQDISGGGHHTGYSPGLARHFSPTASYQTIEAAGAGLGAQSEIVGREPWMSEIVGYSPAGWPGRAHHRGIPHARGRGWAPGAGASSAEVREGVAGLAPGYMAMTPPNSVPITSPAPATPAGAAQAAAQHWYSPIVSDWDALVAWLRGWL